METLTENSGTEYERRGRSRILSSDYLDFRVSVESLSVQDAHLGNISEGGLQFLVPAGEVPKGEIVNSEISGLVFNDRTKMRMNFRGKILWKADRTMDNQKFVAFGVKFNADVLLPESIYAVLLANSEL